MQELKKSFVSLPTVRIFLTTDHTNRNPEALAYLRSELFINAFRWLRERSDRNSKPPAMPVEPKTLYIKNTFSIKRSCSSSRPQSKRCFLWQKNKIWHIRNGCVSTILSSPLSIGENLSMGNTVKRLEEFYDSYVVTKAWRFSKGI